MFINIQISNLIIQFSIKITKKLIYGLVVDQDFYLDAKKYIVDSLFII